MSRSHVWLVGGSIVALGLAAALMVALPVNATELSFTMQCALAIYVASVASFAALRYGETHDPQALFLATGLGVVAFQTAVFCVGWAFFDPLSVRGSIVPGAYGVASPNTGAVPPIAWQAGWAIAGVCFLLAMPWWERRGRPAIGAVKVVGAAAATVMVLDVIVIIWRPEMSSSAFRQIQGQDIPPLGVLGPVSLALGLVAVATLTAAAFRQGMVSGEGSNPHRWLSAAFFLSVSIQIAVLVRPTEGTPLVQWADAFQPFAVLLLFVALLVGQRRETSHLRRTSDRADQIVGDRAEIAGMIAHEVRGPVTTIRGIAATATTHYDRLSDKERQEFFGLIEQESRRLMGTVDHTSLALKIDAGSLTYQKAPASLATIVRAGVEAAAVPVESHVVHVVAQEDVSLVADASRITELVRQLVDNASKYSPPGTPIVVRAVSHGNAAVIEITDEGPGIPKEQRDVIFQRFTRWRPRGYEEQPGNGLGLFICRALVAEHQGEMSVEDGPDGGTMLRVRLPLEGA